MTVRHLFFAAVASALVTTAQAQIKIGDNPGTIAGSSVLEVESTNKGFLPPRVALTADNAAAPVTSPSVGLLVYNTATAGTAPNDVAPGYYFWNGTQWKAFVSTTTVQGAESKAGQYMRIGLNPLTYTVANVQSAVRFNLHNSDAEMGAAPNGAPNYVNTIEGASFTEGASVPAGQGVPGRTTDQIVLPAGLYRITVRLIGNFASATNNSADIKLAVNNNEYSYSNGVTFSTNNFTTTGTVVDYLNLTSTQPVDLLLIVYGSDFTTLTRATPGTGLAYRSLVMIERLK